MNIMTAKTGDHFAPIFYRRKTVNGQVFTLAQILMIEKTTALTTKQEIFYHLKNTFFPLIKNNFTSEFRFLMFRKGTETHYSFFFF